MKLVFKKWFVRTRDRTIYYSSAWQGGRAPGVCLLRVIAQTMGNKPMSKSDAIPIVNHQRQQRAVARGWHRGDLYGCGTASRNWRFTIADGLSRCVPLMVHGTTPTVVNKNKVERHLSTETRTSMLDKMAKLRRLAITARKTNKVAREARWVLGEEVVRLVVKTEAEDAQFTIAQLAKATAKDCGKSVRVQEKFLSEAKLFFFRFPTLELALKETIKAKKKSAPKVKPRVTAKSKQVAIQALGLTQAEWAYVVMERNKK